MTNHINSHSQQFDTGIVPIQSLLRDVENRVRRVWSLLFRLLVGGKHYLVFTPKHETYNSLIYDKKNKIGKEGKY
jgi:hypothetical protein